MLFDLSHLQHKFKCRKMMLRQFFVIVARKKTQRMNIWVYHSTIINLSPPCLMSPLNLLQQLSPLTGIGRIQIHVFNHLIHVQHTHYENFIMKCIMIVYSIMRLIINPFSLFRVRTHKDTLNLLMLFNVIEIQRQ